MNLQAIKLPANIEVLGVAENKRGDNRNNNTKKLIYKEGELLKYANIVCDPGDEVEEFGRIVNRDGRFYYKWCGSHTKDLEILKDYHTECEKFGVTAPTLVVVRITKSGVVKQG